MSVSKSGRIVIIIDPGLKKKIYAALAQEQRTMKDWFIENAQQFIDNQQQPSLFKDNSK